MPAKVEVNILLAFVHRVGIALDPPLTIFFVSDIAIFVLKGDVKLQLTSRVTPKGGTKLLFLPVKLNFCLTKSLEKFVCVKTSSSRVVFPS